MRDRWQIPASAFLSVFVSFGALFSFGVFLTPLADEFGSSTGPVATLFSVAICFYYVGGAVGGRLGDKRGSQMVVAVSAVVLVGGLVLTAAAGELWHAFGSYGVLVGLAIGGGYTSSIGLVGRSFTDARPLALGVLLAGGGVGTLVIPVVAQAVIEAASWRWAYLAMAAAAVPAFGWAALMGDRLRRDAGGAGDEGGGGVAGGSPKLIALGALARDRRFGLFYIACLLLGPGFYAPLVFFNDYAIDQGVGSGAAALLVGISGACSVLGRLGYGVIDQRVRTINLCRASYALHLLALIVWFVSGGSYVLMVVAAVIHGLGWALLAAGTPTILAQWLGAENLGATIGIFYTSLGFGALAGPAVGGFIIDGAGFGTAIVAAIIPTAASVAILLRVDRSEAASSSRIRCG